MTRSAALPIAFVAGAVTAWLNRAPLLQLVAKPVAESWLASPCSKPTFSDQLPSFIHAYSSLALTAGALVALPLAAQLVAVRRHLSPRARERIITSGFVAASYAIELGGVLLVAKLVPSALLNRLLQARGGWCGDNWSLDTTSTIEWYVGLSCLVALAVALLLELGLVIALALGLRAPR
jgi:Sec-independent protein secretion pathway component TatC